MTRSHLQPAPHDTALTPADSEEELPQNQANKLLLQRTFCLFWVIFGLQPENKTTIGLSSASCNQPDLTSLAQTRAQVCSLYSARYNQPAQDRVCPWFCHLAAAFAASREGKQEERASCSTLFNPRCTSPPPPPPPSSPHSSAQLSASLYLPSQSGGSGASPCSCLFCNLEQRAAFLFFCFLIYSSIYLFFCEAQLFAGERQKKSPVDEKHLA